MERCQNAAGSFQDLVLQVESADVATTTITGAKLQSLTGGKIYAPVLIANGTNESFLASNPTNASGSLPIAYFNYVGANTDKVDHFRMLGDNQFGVEDLYGGGDMDFNDVIIKFTI